MASDAGPGAQRVASHSITSRVFHEVWASDLDDQFDALLAAVERAAHTGAVVALDMEFPGFLQKEPRWSARGPRYQALRENVDRLWPIQMGVAVASGDGRFCGVWCFNLHFDAEVDAHSEPSLDFLHTAGIDFPRHRSEGIEATALGRRLACSRLFGRHWRAPWWLTFSGAYDLGYLLKLLTSGRPLPQDPAVFDRALDVYCPHRHDLRHQLPHGSLESLGRQLGVRRYGRAHQAGSDALLTLELYLHLARVSFLQNSLAKAWGPWHPHTWPAWSQYRRWEEWELYQAAPWPDPWALPPAPPLVPWASPTDSYVSQGGRLDRLHEPSSERFYPRSQTFGNSVQGRLWPIVV